MSEPKYPVERADLTRLPWRALAVVAKAIESGDRKYQAGDWIMAPQRIDGRRDLNSALRHIAEFVEGKNVDEDSGESPLAHAAARLLFLLEREARGIKGGGWRIGQPIVPLATDSDPGSSNFRLPLTPRVCGAVGGDGRGHVALCGLDKGHPWPHRFTVPDITDERPKSTSDEAWDPIADERSLHGALIFCTAFRDIGGKPFLCGLDAGHDGPHSFTVRPHGDDERESVPDDHLIPLPTIALAMSNDELKTAIDAAQAAASEALAEGVNHSETLDHLESLREVQLARAPALQVGGGNS